MTKTILPMTSPSHAIADTSTLSALARIGCLDLLPLRFGSVRVPDAVWRELEAGKEMEAIETASRAGWLQIVGVADSSWQPPISRLGSGETAVLALAMETSDTIILMDEKRGRRAARILGLQTTGVLGILSWAKHAGHIPSLAQAISDLRTKDRFFIAPDLLCELLEAAGETME